LTRKYIAPFLFLYKDWAIAHGVQYQPKGQHQNLSLHFEVWKNAPSKMACCCRFSSQGAILL
jgi:hypothetical protein